METVQGYVILKAATFETGHGFALGHNPGAPSPFVTWQFTEGENGHRDYYWGRYGTSQAWAQRDFDRRVDDYGNVQQGDDLVKGIQTWMLTPVFKIHDRAWGTVYKLCKIFLRPTFCLSLALDLPA